MEEKKIKMTYLMCDGNLYKIGESDNPEKRLKQLKTANPFIELICFGNGVSEKYLHELFFQKRRKGEWFNLSEDNLQKCKRLIVEGEDKNYVYAFERKEGENYFTLSDQQIKFNMAMKKASADLNKVYKINFGKYKGTRICDTTTQEQYDYCVWFLNSYKDTLISKRARTRDRKYKAFSWWVRLGYKQYLNSVK